MHILPLIVLAIVFIMIAVRQIGSVKLAIWQIMLGGALIVLITQQISPTAALHAINLDVILFLFGMFVVGHALEESGYLSHLSNKLFKKAKTIDTLLLLTIFSTGILSALLMNDAIAIIGTPVMLLIAQREKTSAKPFLLTLMFSVTIGSIMSPIGNPQNLLIATQGNMINPFVDFLKYLFIPTIINLFILFIFIKLSYKKTFSQIKTINPIESEITNQPLAHLSKISLVIIVVMICAKIVLVMFLQDFDFKLTYIAIAAALPILIFSKKRIHILKNIDWHTLIFFAAMFVLMASVWSTGFFQNIFSKHNLNLSQIPSIFAIAIIVSQFISNVPLVALYMPMLLDAGANTKALVALAAASTIAGNLLILGAASNIIVIQNAEKRSDTSITFWEFVRIGLPLTLVNTIVYLVWLSVF